MIKTILWDFDGVILDSMKIKGDGFLELFKEFSKEDLEKIEEYHYTHGGVSRFEKIRYFYNDILNKDIDDSKILVLADKFAEIIKVKLYDKNNLIEETLNYIEKNYRKYNFHIVSGAEHNELNKLCDSFEISKYFISIDGSPTPKDKLVKNVIEKFRYTKVEVILIGDAITDLNASIKNNIDFYGYNNPELKKYKYIDNFMELII